MKDKKKLTINTLAMGNLKQRKKQYTILIIGIVLAMVFSSGIMFFYSCMKTSVAENRRISYGAQEVIFTCTNTVDFENTPVYEFISECGYAYSIGYAYKDKSNPENGTAVSRFDSKAKELYYFTFIEGGYPQNKGEIAIDKSVMVKLGVGDKKVGDKITLNMFIADSEGYSDKSEEREFTLVGIVSDRKKYMDSLIDGELGIFQPGAYVHESEEVALGGKEIVSAYCNLTDFEGKRKDNYKLYNDAFEESCPDYENSSFRDILVERWSRYTSASAVNEITENMYYSMIFAAVLTLVSCLAIVNSFGNNLRERKKQIGMFRAVGATRRQIVKIFAREALIISLICTPVSVLISYFGVKFLTGFFGENFIFVPDFSALFLGAGVGVICVMCAALIPLLTASKISPMQAIRNVELARKLKKKKIKSRKDFNVPKLLSDRSITFFRSRQIIVSILLAVTIFCSCVGFSFLISEYSEISSIWYDYCLYRTSEMYDNFANYNLNDVGYTENHRADLVTSGYFSEINGYKQCQATIVVGEYTDYMKIMAIGRQMDIYPNIQMGLTKDNYREKITSGYNSLLTEAQKKYGYDSLLFGISMNAFDEDAVATIKDEIIEGEINIDKINSGEEVLIVCPEKIGFYIDTYESDDGTYTFPECVDLTKVSEKYLEKTEILEEAERSFKVGDEITVSVVNSDEKGEEFIRTDKKVKIGAILKEIPSKGMYAYHFGSDVSILTTNSGIEHFAPDLDYGYFSLWAKDELNETLDKEISSYLEDVSLGVVKGNYRSEYACEQNNREQIKIILVAMISIILLFFTICGSVINNALSARIREGKKEIGTLRAVGADMKTIVKSYIRQLISMFGWGYGIGFGGYTLAHVVMKALEKTGVLYESEMEYQVWQVGVMSIGLFLICAINLTLKIKQEMKHSIVENIREL